MTYRDLGAAKARIEELEKEIEKLKAISKPSIRQRIAAAWIARKASKEHHYQVQQPSRWRRFRLWLLAATPLPQFFLLIIFIFSVFGITLRYDHMQSRRKFQEARRLPHPSDISYDARRFVNDLWPTATPDYRCNRRGPLTECVVTGPTAVILVFCRPDTHECRVNLAP